MDWKPPFDHDAESGQLSGDSNVSWSAPPPYELHSSGNILASSATLNGDT